MTDTATTGPDPDHHARARAGVGYGFGAYALWGLLPLYFVLLAPATPYEIVAMRILFSLLFCLLLLAVTGGLRDYLRLFRDRQAVLALGAAGVLIAGNWLLYTVAATTGHTLEASLGYFINPLVAILLGVLVLHEKLRRMQWAAIAVGAASVLVMSVFYGAVPWLSLGLAFTFGFYGLVKSRLGSRYSALVTLSGETTMIAPLALAAVAVLGSQHRLTLVTEGAGHFLLLLAAGVITAVPLLLFGAAASRLPLSTVGMIQYVAPIGQFILAVALFHEQMPPERWAGFGLVWVAVVLLVLDAVRAPRAPRLARRSGSGSGRPSAPRD
ncbi:EamA family transporter RarD [Kocuria sp.]|uniref:EamA family transporter RarD n=1 Tax=Kocuria sp. TaxID=1871328 RepID=UPI0026DA92E5|nr:EamA family transporter RarD [Kocuria sp.]MDO4918371.1 EamA family transporter RarD [Kocuria sp.]